MPLTKFSCTLRVYKFHFEDFAGTILLFLFSTVHWLLFGSQGRTRELSNTTSSDGKGRTLQNGNSFIPSIHIYPYTHKYTKYHAYLEESCFAWLRDIKVVVLHCPNIIAMSHWDRPFPTPVLFLPCFHLHETTFLVIISQCNSYTLIGWGEFNFYFSIFVNQFSSVQSLSCVQLFVTPWTVAHQASLSVTNSQSLLKCISIDLVIPSNHLILCHPLLLLPSTFPSIRVFSNEPFLCIRWTKYWSFSFNINSSNEHSGLNICLYIHVLWIYVYKTYAFYMHITD